MAQVSINLNPELSKKLTDYSNKVGLSKTKTIVIALSNFFTSGESIKVMETLGIREDNKVISKVCKHEIEF
jgi:hypothetical protein